VEGIDPLPKLVPDELHRVFRFPASDVASVNQKARRLVYGDEMFVLIQ
jgi:hypothetical protein